MFRDPYRKTLGVLAALVLGSALPGAAQTPPSLEKSELQLQLESQGWSSVRAGVFERRLEGNRVERRGYGPEGYASALNDLQQQVDRLMKLYEADPSYEVAKAIEEHAAMIAKLRGELSRLVSGDLESAPQALDGPSCTSTCFSATADAYPLSSSQGVGAVGEATFNSSCGIVGEAMTSAMARAFQGSTRNDVMQSDSKVGNPITSRATVQAAGGNGTESCYSQATALVSSSQLGFVYTTFDYSDGVCPAPPLDCAISGTTYEVVNAHEGCVPATWYALASGGTPPYNYSWGGTTYLEYLCPYQGQTNIQLTVTDSTGQQCNRSLYVWVETQQPRECTYYWNCPLEP